MGTDGLDPRPEFEQIDADAVCEVCGEVNPPGTLLCKKCGNNLRDQRLGRLGDQAAPMEQMGPRVQPRRVLSVLLTAVALLLVLWALLPGNMERLESWLTEGFSTAGAEDMDPEVFWSRGEREPYEALVTQMAEEPLPRNAINGGTGLEINAEDYTGRYLILRPSGVRLLKLGEAAVNQEGEDVFFVAKLDGSGVEIRGKGTLKEDGTVETRLVGIRSDEGTEGGYGFATLDENGVLLCYGMAWGRDDQYEVTLRRVQ